ncbi:MAG TPA: hypothetical protein PLV05_01195 [Verrucomicrobiota bacterium]|jgi:type IV secretory pathway VirB10-like protein|nr:hypothetical protein [Verrucomicrobiota bacterium]OQC26641.1 MAG: hypothetical protein BWX68_00574 [Verrucomicrobia bacterium ADurb.Bin063]HRR63662.1 hypothetical protein [Candidatus Paceibacterota bacterium]MBP8015219.1 hypothetical protein [Verrucomicrobiota bacterium]MDI9373779.1 hypothetical protein [Verrucomicrobiota bacterium]
MQISKSFLIACAAAYGATALPLYAEDTEAQVRARVALEQKLNELQSQPQPAEAPAPAPETPPPTRRQAKSPKIASPKAEKAKAPAPTPAPDAPAESAAAPAAARKPAPARAASALPQIEGPGAAISAEKQQRLDELLTQYRADQITPEEYHQLRAKILAEP